jgi:predicted nucleotidyltransferase
MGPLQELAADLGADERTLRRAAAQGTLRIRRPGPRRLQLPPGEHAYLRGNWGLLADLRQALRTEREVRLAVLFGSLARGDGDAGSDLDLLVSPAGDGWGTMPELAARLGGVSGRDVDIALMDRVETTAPLLLERILDEGRVLVDRDGLWAGLQDRRRAIRARGLRAHRRQMASAAAALEELVG